MRETEEDKVRSNVNNRAYLNMPVKTQVSERRLIEETVEVIGVSSGMGVIVLLGVDYEEYIVPDTMYSGDVEDLVEQLPIKMKIKHMNNRVLSIED